MGIAQGEREGVAFSRGSSSSRSIVFVHRQGLFRFPQDEMQPRRCRGVRDSFAPPFPRSVCRRRLAEVRFSFPQCDSCTRMLTHSPPVLRPGVVGMRRSTYLKTTAVHDDEYPPIHVVLFLCLGFRFQGRDPSHVCVYSPRLKSGRKRVREKVSSQILGVMFLRGLLPGKAASGCLRRGTIASRMRRRPSIEPHDAVVA